MASELLSSCRLESLKNIRESELENSLKELYRLWLTTKEDSSENLPVEMKQWLGDINLNVKDHKGRNILHYAHQNYFLETFQNLIDIHQNNFTLCMFRLFSSNYSIHDFIFIRFIFYNSTHKIKLIIFNIETCFKNLFLIEDSYRFDEQLLIFFHNFLLYSISYKSYKV